MNALDYYKNIEITQKIYQLTKRIKTKEDREDCAQEIYTELYDVMPLATKEAIALIELIAKRYKRNRKYILDNETTLEGENGY